jgi:PAS domain S-box-containing protein
MAGKFSKTRVRCSSDDVARLKARMARLRARLAEAEETLQAIREGHVDALVVQSPAGEQVFTLKGVDHRYRQLVETMNEGALLVAPNGIIVYSNARFAELVKRPLAETIGASIHAFVPERGRPIVDALLKAAAGSKTEVEIVDADGRHIPVYLSATTSIDDGERVVGVIATDLSEQRRTQEVVAAERFAASILDQAADAIVVCDVHGRVIRASQAAHWLARANPLLQPFSSAFRLQFAPGSVAAPSPVAAALRGQRLSGVEATLRRADGVVVDLLVSAGPVLNDEGDSVGCVLSFVDVTERKAVAAERLQLLEGAEMARVAAESANRAKDQFLAMLGHELRNPLAPILTALDLMRLKGDESLIRERTVIERQVRHVVRLVDDLLDVSRITQGKVDLDRKPVELAQLVVRAVESASPLIEQRQHRLSIDVPRVGLLLLGDEMRLCQVVANLLTNAAKYTDPQGRIHVAGARHGDEIVLTVTDSGAGIPAEILPTLFDTFVQGRRTIDRSEGGLGLGLAIVRNLVTLHGGSVAARSDGVGRGSEFEVRLPALRVGSRVAAAPLPPALPAALHSQPRRILVVDDNVDAAELLAASLQALGHEIRIAHDGPSALRAAVEFAPEVALLDIGLPVMDGYELARRMRMNGHAHPRLVALTGYGQHTDRERSVEAGFDEHLVKPVAIGKLTAVITQLTHGSPAP